MGVPKPGGLSPTGCIAKSMSKTALEMKTKEPDLTWEQIGGRIGASSPRQFRGVVQSYCKRNKLMAEFNAVDRLRDYKYFNGAGEDSSLTRKT